MVTHQVLEVVESNITLLDLFREGASEVSSGPTSNLGFSYINNEGYRGTRLGKESTRIEERKKNSQLANR